MKNKSELQNETHLFASKAQHLFEEGFNCSQSVFLPFAGEFGLDRSTALKIAADFGGGIARTGNVCGAVTGALMALGLKYGNTDAGNSEAKELDRELAQSFITRFDAKHCSHLCCELLGCDISTPEGRETAKEKNLRDRSCMHYVHDAAEMVAEILHDPALGRLEKDS